MSEPRDPVDRWAEVEALFAQAADLPEDAREAFLAGLEDAAIQREVRSLVAHLAPDGAVIEAAIGRVADQWAAATDSAFDAAATAIGRRYGAFEVTGVLGQGGMGAVYLARRADGQFEQDAAIKLVRHGFETPVALERFRQERQILARLTHPSIARLLDGGTALDEAGADTPFLVMEYVEGEPITTYCTNHAVGMADRIALFRLVCDAVQYAHQQLVVHRDIKPTNILVTRTGQPKLLDFGIAKLVTDEDVDRSTRTATAHLILTPDYASPEQVTGDRVTAAADIYSLGVLLYELLTGQKAHQFRTLSPVEIGRVVCDTEPIRPSLAVPDSAPDAARLRRQLEGDVDTIVLKALQKDPARRYQSVEQLSEDLRRHLEGLPVLARPDTLTYRTAKFARRNRWAILGCAAVAASLIAGTIVSVWQARRAERRFDQVRALANSLIYDLHDEIREVPGSTKVQQKIVATGLDYLNRLAREAGGDARLQRDLAAAYLRIADVQGGPLASNLGDVKGALDSYRKARELFEQSAGPDRPRQLAAVDVKIGEALSYHGDVAGALAAYAQAQATLEPVATAAEAGTDDLEQLSTVLQGLARVQGIARDSVRSLETSQRLLALRRSLHDREAGNPVRLDKLAESEAEVSMALQRLGKPGDALPHARQSLAFREDLAGRQPNNVPAQRNLILSYSHVADVLGNPTLPSLGDAAGAIDLYRKMTAVAERLVAADAFDSRAKWDLSNCLMRLGSALVSSPARVEGIATLERGAALMREIAAAEPANNRVRITLAFISRRLGDTLAEGGRSNEAVDHFEEAIRVSEAVLAKDPSEGSAVTLLATSHSGRGVALARIGRYEAALGEGRRGVEVADRARRTQPGNARTRVLAAGAWAAMGRIHFARGSAGDRAQGCVWFDQSLKAYREIQRAAPLDAPTAADMEAASRDSASCR